jgi:hypothetical protein
MEMPPNATGLCVDYSRVPYSLYPDPAIVDREFQIASTPALVASRSTGKSEPIFSSYL